MKGVLPLPRRIKGAYTCGEGGRSAFPLKARMSLLKKILYAPSCREIYREIWGGDVYFLRRKY